MSIDHDGLRERVIAEIDRGAMDAARGRATGSAT